MALFYDISQAITQKDHYAENRKHLLKQAFHDLWAKVRDQIRVSTL